MTKVNAEIPLDRLSQVFGSAMGIDFIRDAVLRMAEDGSAIVVVHLSPLGKRRKCVTAGMRSHRGVNAETGQQGLHPGAEGSWRDGRAVRVTEQRSCGELPSHEVTNERMSRDDAAFSGCRLDSAFEAE